MRTAVITVSTRVARGDAEDLSGARLAELSREAGAEVVATEVVTDDRMLIEARLRHHVAGGCSFVFTTGGTGFTTDAISTPRSIPLTMS